MTAPHEAAVRPAVAERASDQSQASDAEAMRHVQGRDEISIDAPIERVWELVADSRLLPKWGPPVKGVELVDQFDRPEGLGSRRRVDAKFGDRQGHYLERRIAHDPPRRMAFLIEAETFGLFRMLDAVGSVIDLEPDGPDRTRVTWTFFHRPHGLVGHVMNRIVIRRQQRRNRLAALASLQRYAESGQERPTP
jgi:uncharacterized protein YndB with AHSA1/START domain